MPKRRWGAAGTADLDDIDHIRHAADLLWEDSLFEQPIRKLIYAAYANASLFALRSASHKLLNYAQNAREYLDFRYQGLTVAFDELELNIARLEDDMAMLQTRQNVVSDEVAHEVEQTLTATDAFMAQQNRSLRQAIGDVFSRRALLNVAGLIHTARAEVSRTRCSSWCWKMKGRRRWC